MCRPITIKLLRIVTFESVFWTVSRFALIFCLQGGSTLVLGAIAPNLDLAPNVT